MRGALAACALGALLLAGGTAAGGRPLVYATLSKGTTSELVRVDPATLEITGRRLPLWRHDVPWVRSPDGSRLALGSGRARSIRVVDLPNWYVVRDVVLPRHLVALAWPRPHRLLAVITGRCCPQTLRALALDPASGLAMRSGDVGRGATVAAARTPDGLALLLAPPTGIGAPRLVTIDADARIRSTRVSGVEVGWKTVGRVSASAPPVSRYSTPGLAVDPSGRRALVADGSTLAVVDLRTGAVRVAPIRVRTLADGGFSFGAYRRAVWLQRDVVAVTGWTDRVAGKGAHARQTTAPAGLLLVDVSTLTARRIDARARSLTRAGNLLLATGSAGVTAYDLDGRRRYRAMPRRWLADLPVAGRYAYIGGPDTYKHHRVQVLDLRTARTRGVWVRGALNVISEAAPRICWC